MQNKRIRFPKNSDSILAILTTSAKFPKVQKRTQITRITCCNIQQKMMLLNSNKTRKIATINCPKTAIQRVLPIYTEIEQSRTICTQLDTLLFL